MSGRHVVPLLLVLVACSREQVASPPLVADPARVKPKPRVVAPEQLASLEASTGDAAIDEDGKPSLQKRPAAKKGIPLPYTPVGSVAPERAAFESSTNVDFATIPLMKETNVAAGLGPTLRIVRTEKTPFCATGSPRKKTLWYAARSWTQPTILRVGDATLPDPASLDGKYDDATGPIAKLNTALTTHAEWVAIDRPKRTATELGVERFSGSFENMGVAADVKGAVRAIALVPDAVYAFRRCTSGCDLPAGDPAHAEELEVIGPIAEWYGSTGPTTRQRFTPGQAFTDLAVSIAPGSSATVQLDLSSAQVAAFGGKKAQPGESDKVTSYVIDLVWQDGDAPDVVLHTGHATLVAKLPHGAPRSTWPDCEHTRRELLYDPYR